MAKEGELPREGSTSPEGDQCPICFAVYLAESAVETNCGHKFCRQCIVNVLKASQPLRLAKCPCCRQAISPFNMVCGGQKLVEYPTTIFGGIYIQWNMEGLASYHFEEEESYISYSAAPPYWRLDDGSPPPVRKPFLNSSYNMDTRTFRGTIDWSLVNWHGNSKWVYRIVFSEDFMAIDSGEVVIYDSQGEETNEACVYGQQIFYERSLDIEQLISQ